MGILHDTTTPAALLVKLLLYNLIEKNPSLAVLNDLCIFFCLYPSSIAAAMAAATMEE